MAEKETIKVTQIPEPPQSTMGVQEFNEKADSSLSAFPTLVEELNAIGIDISKIYNKFGKDYVTLSTSQNISGVKNFTKLPTTAIDPSDESELVRLGYVQKLANDVANQLPSGSGGGSIDSGHDYSSVNKIAMVMGHPREITSSGELAKYGSLTNTHCGFITSSFKLKNSRTGTEYETGTSGKGTLNLIRGGRINNVTYALYQLGKAQGSEEITEIDTVKSEEDLQNVDIDDTQVLLKFKSSLFSPPVAMLNPGTIVDTEIDLASNFSTIDLLIEIVKGVELVIHEFRASDGSSGTIKLIVPMYEYKLNSTTIAEADRTEETSVVVNRGYTNLLPYSIDLTLYSVNYQYDNTFRYMYQNNSYAMNYDYPLVSKYYADKLMILSGKTVPQEYSTTLSDLMLANKGYVDYMIKANGGSKSKMLILNTDYTIASTDNAGLGAYKITIISKVIDAVVTTTNNIETLSVRVFNDDGTVKAIYIDVNTGFKVMGQIVSS